VTAVSPGGGCFARPPQILAGILVAIGEATADSSWHSRRYRRVASQCPICMTYRLVIGKLISDWPV